MKNPTKNKTPPFSLRLTEEERAQLDIDAAGMSLGAYIRSRLFDASLQKRKTRGKFPVKDHIALAKILSELGRSNISENLNHLAKAVKTGSLPVSPETEQKISDCCRDIKHIRFILISALGLTPENDYDTESLSTLRGVEAGKPFAEYGRQ